MKTLLIAEHDASVLSDATARALTAATGLGGEIDVLVVGHGVGAIARSCAALLGVSRVLVVDDDSLVDQLAECVGAQIMALSQDYGAVVAAATTTGKNLLPRIAAALDVMQVSDVIEVVDERTFKRPIYAGSAIQTVQVIEGPLVLTIRGAAFSPAASGYDAPIIALAVAPCKALTRVIENRPSVSDRPDLAAARIVVSGGRALGSKESFDALILPLAEKLGAAIGASRAAVDAGYAANDMQVGQTGRIVAPELYIACGISGAIQHLAGMKDSRIIVAINKDADAPIFEIADYGLVGDLFDVLPALREAL